jgi:two-component system phosphate regulon response regulator PhoB
MASPTILVVEDNIITNKMMRVTLQTGGYQALEALDGKTALKLTNEHKPDLIFVDLLLPDMDGIELTRQLRRLPACREIPIIAVSGLQSKLDEARMLVNGFTSLLFKPVTPQALLESIEHLLPPTGAATATQAQGVSMLVVDDDQVQGKIQRLHFESLGYQVTFAPERAGPLYAGAAGPIPHAGPDCRHLVHVRPGRSGRNKYCT